MMTSSLIETQRNQALLDISHHVRLREHDTLRRPGRIGRIRQDGDVVWPVAGLGTDSLRPLCTPQTVHYITVQESTSVGALPVVWPRCRMSPEGQRRRPTPGTESCLRGGRNPTQYEPVHRRRP